MIIDDMPTEEETTITTSTSSLSDAMREEIQSYVKSVSKWSIPGEHKYYQIHEDGLILYHDLCSAKVVQPSIYYNHPHLEMKDQLIECVLDVTVTVEKRKEAIELRDMLKTYYSQLYDELVIE